MRLIAIPMLFAAALGGACVHARQAPDGLVTAQPAGGLAGVGTAVVAQGAAPAGLAWLDTDRVTPARPVPAPPGSPASPASPRAPADSVSAADVTRETARVFGNAAPPPITDTMAAPGAPVWDIDVRSYETRTRVGDYVRIFSGRAKGVFELALQRQTRYGPMIRERLRRVGLPENLTYLALVESWFNPHAYSRAAAVGVWQFMAGTGRGMGLRVDWWIDERRDPVRSTEAAARLLLGLREEFGSLYLAAAAYNGGSGRVSRGLARYAVALEGVEGEDRFFALAEKSYLRPETRDYVPKIIGAALVGEEPARYGVRVDSLPPYAYDSVRAPGETPLAAVANALGVDAASLDELNPQVLRGMTPPGDSMWVRVPVGRATDFESRFSALDPGERRALQRIESRKGQTMASIAKAHGLTARQLAWYNPKAARLKSGALRAGQVILVPRRDVAALARDIPNPTVERYPRRASGVRRHTVTSGQTLTLIARKYGISVKTLMQLNGLKAAQVMPGQVLVVSGRSAPKKSAAKSGTSRAGASKAGTSRAGTSKAGTSKAGTSKAGTAKAGASKGGAARPGAAKAKPKAGATKSRTRSAPAGASNTTPGHTKSTTKKPAAGTTAKPAPR